VGRCGSPVKRGSTLLTTPRKIEGKEVREALSNWYGEPHKALLTYDQIWGFVSSEPFLEGWWIRFLKGVPLKSYGRA